VPLFLAAQIPISFDQLRKKPRSITKDFYISRFLEQNCTQKEAEALLCDVKNLNTKLFNRFEKRLGDPAFSMIKRCRNLPANSFVNESPSCIMVGLSLAKAGTLPPQTLEKIAQSIETTFPYRARLYRLVAKHSCRSWYQESPKTFIHLFNLVGKNYRRKFCNRPFPPALLNRLTREPSFSKSVALIVRDGNLTALHKSLLKIDSSALSSDANFLLALNAVRLGHEEIAEWYLKMAEKRAYYSFYLHRAQLWRYLITNDRKILKQLASAKEIDLYTLYAHEQLNLPMEHITTAILPKSQKAPFDITDPFLWLDLKAKRRDFEDPAKREAWALSLNSADTEPHVARLLYDYKKRRNFFLMPYLQYMKGMPVERKAMILALARQESNFIPTEVSTSYALGMMQFMPFVAEEIAKRNGMEGYTHEWMFDPQKAILFADIHLNMLKSRLSHPLFIAYAYNAGLGFTKRQILNRDYFRKGKYEPFWSMEMIPNAQARKYGKRVLANYVIYRALLGNPVSLTTLLRSVVSPSRTDRSGR